jgi:hypothetical protein
MRRQRRLLGPEGSCSGAAWTAQPFLPLLLLLLMLELLRSL